MLFTGLHILSLVILSINPYQPWQTKAAMAISLRWTWEERKEDCLYYNGPAYRGRKSSRSRNIFQVLASSSPIESFNGSYMVLQRVFLWGCGSHSVVLKTLMASRVVTHATGLAPNSCIVRGFTS